MLFKVFKSRSLQVDKPFANDRFFFSSAPLYVHQSGERDGGGLPLARRPRETLERTHVSGQAGCDTHCSRRTERTAVRAIEIRRKGRTPFIAKKMGNSFKRFPLF